MQKIVGVIFILFSINLSAQITINSTHMPQGGDTLRYSVGILDTAVLFNYQTPGANQTWNFDSLKAIRQEVRRFVNSNQTSYNTISNRIAEKVFDTLALGPTNLYDVYDFYRNSTAEFVNDYRGASIPTGLGWPFPASIKLTPQFSDKDEIYQFPLNYLDRDSSTYAFTFGNTTLGIYYGSNGYRINEVDAWGSLTTPYGTFNCIRVVTDLVRFDSITVAGTSFGLPTHTRQYKWLTTQFEIPAMEVDGIVLGNLFLPTNVVYRDSARGKPALLAPVPLFIGNNFTPFVGDTVNFTNLSIGLFNTNYNWKVSPNTFNYTNSTSATTDSLTLIFNDTGFYDIGLIAANNFGSDSLVIPNYIYVSQLATSISKLNFDSENDLTVYPNPSQKQSTLYLRLDNKAKIDEIKIYNQLGMVVEFSLNPIGSDKYEVQFSKSSGIYYVSILIGSEVYTKKLVIK